MTNPTHQSVEVAVCGSLRNFIGVDGSKFHFNWKGDMVPYGEKKNKNEFRNSSGLSGIYLFSEGVDKNDPAWGTMALTTQAEQGVSYRTSSVPDVWEQCHTGFLG